MTFAHFVRFVTSSALVAPSLTVQVVTRSGISSDATLLNARPFVNESVDLQLHEVNGRRQGLSSKMEVCRTTHPIELLQQFDTDQLLECYSIWHRNKLASWHGSTQEYNQRFAYVVQCGVGLGDFGQMLMGAFRDAFSRGAMLLIDFTPAGPSNVYRDAMIPPFDWNVSDHLSRLGYTNTSFQSWRNEHMVWIGREARFLPCPSCVVQEPSSVGEDVFAEEQVKLIRFLYQPNPEVEEVVNDVLRDIGAGMPFYGLHFRGEWMMGHDPYGCFCQDYSLYGRCAASMESLFPSKVGKTMRIFVAADSTFCMNAFRNLGASVADRVVTLPDELPIEHSLTSSVNGSIRNMADFLLLAKAEAVFGSCGSRFSALSQLYSGRSEKMLVLSNDPSLDNRCPVLDGLNLTAFSWENLGHTSAEESKYCSRCQKRVTLPICMQS